MPPPRLNVTADERFEVVAKKCPLGGELVVTATEVQLFDKVTGATLQCIPRQLIVETATKNDTGNDVRVQLMVESDGKIRKAKYQFVGDNPLMERQRFINLVAGPYISPNAKSKKLAVSDEERHKMRMRARVLAQDKTLRELHKNLVEDGEFTTDEFWKKYWYDEWNWLQSFLVDTHHVDFVDVILRVKDMKAVERDNKILSQLSLQELEWLLHTSSKEHVMKLWRYLGGGEGVAVVESRKLQHFLETLAPVRQSAGLSNETISGRLEQTKETMVRALLQRLNKSNDPSQIHIELTWDEMHQIFVLMPEVHKMYIDMVPVQMSEQDFWNQFCQGHYFMNVA